MHNLTEAQRKECLGDFYKIVASFHDYNEAKNFFKDLLTSSEMIMISRRIQVAKYLMEGMTHEQVIEALGVGSGTVVQVDRWLHDGNRGYRQVLKKFKDEEKIKKASGSSHYSLAQLRKKFPVQFIFLHLLMDKSRKS